MTLTLVPCGPDIPALIFPTAAEIAPAAIKPDHPDHRLARLYEDWRLLCEGYEAALEARDDSKLGDRADDVLDALARQPAVTMAGIALKLTAARFDAAVQRPGEMALDDLTVEDRPIEGARLDAMRLARSTTTDAR